MAGVCVVTGASGGIGRAAALELARRSVGLVLGGRDGERLAETASACRAVGSDPVEATGDVGDPKYCGRLFAAARREVGRAAPPEGDGTELAAVLAAGAARFGPTLDLPDGVWEETLRANLTGLFYTSREAVRTMLQAGGGRIVAVLSVAAREAFPESAAYVASKFGGLGLVRSLSAEYRAKGIHFTAFMPGSTDTRLWDRAGLSPDRSAMLAAEDVGRAIADVVCSPGSGVCDEVLYMPPLGVL